MRSRTSPEFGIYTAADGGVIEANMYSQAEADARLAELIAEDADNEGDLSVVEVVYRDGEPVSIDDIENEDDDEEGEDG